MTKHTREAEPQHIPWKVTARIVFLFFYHIGLRGDAQRQRVDAAAGEDTQVRGESAARRQGHLLLKDVAGRQH